MDEKYWEYNLKKIPKTIYVTQAESKPADMHIMDSNVIPFEKLEWQLHKGYFDWRMVK